MLVYDYIKEDYSLTYIIDDIKDAERVLTPDSSKQIIYYDDFLGSNEVEINKAKGRETILRKILRLVTSYENKVLVFTTRSFLLNTAIAESENLNRFNIKANESVLELTEYNGNIKKAILRNHIEDSDLKNEIKDFLREKRNESFITEHTSFSPRIVEFITNKEVVNKMTVSEYENFLYSSINSPINIWEHAYNYQIKEDDRLLLNTLLSFGDSASINELENAFQSRIDLEIQTNNKKKEVLAFKKALKRLADGFIVIKDNKRKVQFINPSLTDFLMSYLRNDSDEVMRIAKSVRYTSQLTKRLFSLSSILNTKIPDVLEEKLLNNYSSFLSNNDDDGELIQLALVIYKYIESTKAEKVVCEIISKIDDWSYLHEDYSLNIYFREFLQAIQGNNNVYQIVEEKIIDILLELIKGENEIFDAIKMLEEFLLDYNINLRYFDSRAITTHFEDLLSEYIDQEIYELKDIITDKSEADFKREEIVELTSRISKSGVRIEPDLDEFDEIEWLEIAIANEFRRQIEKDD